MTIFSQSVIHCRKKTTPLTHDLGPAWESEGLSRLKSTDGEQRAFRVLCKFHCQVMATDNLAKLPSQLWVRCGFVKDPMQKWRRF